MESLADQREYEVMRRARLGDEDALGSLVDSNAGALIGYIARMVNDYHQAEDLAQETFIRAFEHLDKFDIRRPFRPWLFKIGRNLALNYLASRGGRERAETVEIDGRTDIATERGPEKEFEDIERRKGIEMVLGLLPAHFREVLHLRYLEGLEYESIASTLDLPVGTVKTWLHRAKKAFLTSAETAGIDL